MLQLGTDKFGEYLGILLLTSSDIEKLLREKKIPENQISQLSDPFTYLLQSAKYSESFFLELTNAFTTFIKEEITLLPDYNIILIGRKEEKRLITKDNFLDFQTILNIQNRKEVPEPPPPNESAAAKRMRLLKEKRDAVKRKQQQKNGDGMDLITLMEIAEVFGINYKEKSLYAFYSLIQRYQQKEKWEQDIQMLCAGADSKKIKATYWGLSSK